MSTQEHDAPPRSDKTQGGEPDTGQEPPQPQPDAHVIGTNDPGVASGPADRPEWKRHPDRTMVVETNRVRESDDPRTPGAVIVPFEYDRSDDEGQEGAEDEGAKSGTKENGKGQPDHHEKPGGPGDRRKEGLGQPAQGASMTRVLLFSGLVALACGVAGAWGYMHFFGASKSGDQKSSDKSSGSGRGSESSDKGSGSDSGDKSDSKKEPAEGKSSLAGKDDARAQDESPQTENLNERVDRLTEQMDRLTTPRDPIAPDVRTMQVKVGQLERSFGQMGDLSSRFRRIEERLDGLTEQLKLMQKPAPRSEAGRAATPPTPPTGTSPAAPSAEVLARDANAPGPVRRP